MGSEAGEAVDVQEQDLPPFPKADARGRFPALEYARVSLARDLIRARKGAGLSQQALANLTGLRQESISRLETGKYTARPGTVNKIMDAIERQRQERGRKGANETPARGVRQVGQCSPCPSSRARHGRSRPNGRPFLYP